MDLPEYIAVAIIAHTEAEFGATGRTTAVLTPAQIVEYINNRTKRINIDQDIANDGIDLLRLAGVLEVIRTPHAQARIWISKAGIDSFRTNRDTDSSEIKSALGVFNRLGWEWLTESIDNSTLALANNEDDSSISVEIPASDRYVSTIDNSAKEPISADLRELADAIRGDNESDEETKQIYLSEIAAFESTLIQPRVPIDLIERFVNKVLKYVLILFSGEILHEVAKRLVEELVKLI